MRIVCTQRDNLPCNNQVKYPPGYKWHPQPIQFILIKSDGLSKYKVYARMHLLMIMQNSYQQINVLIQCTFLILYVLYVYMTCS